MGSLRDEYDPSEGDDKIKLLADFQGNRLEDAKVNVTEWITSLARQVVKLAKLNDVIDEEYQITISWQVDPRKWNSGGAGQDRLKKKGIDPQGAQEEAQREVSHDEG